MNLLDVFLDQDRLGVKRSMGRVRPIVDKEWPVLVFLHERHGLLGQSIFDVFTRKIGFEVQLLRKLPRCRIRTRGSGAGPVGNVDIEALLTRAVGLMAEMPLPKVSSGVTRTLKYFGQRFHFEVKPGCRDRGTGLPRF